MKKVFGLCILAILFLVAAGCTQSAPSTQMTTTVPTTIVAQETTAAMVTVMPTENATPATTVDVNATMGMANATAPSSETAVENKCATNTLACPDPAGYGNSNPYPEQHVQSRSDNRAAGHINHVGQR